MTIQVPNPLLNEIWDYCRVNKITNIDEFTLGLLTKGFTIEKYGATPETAVVEKVVEKAITNDADVAKLHEELQQVKAKNAELLKTLDQREKIKDIYGES